MLSLVHNLRFSSLMLLDMADFVEGLAHLLEDLRYEPKFLLRHHQHHADTQVERAPVIVVGKITQTLEQIENRLVRPRAAIDYGACPAGQNARNVVGHARRR